VNIFNAEKSVVSHVKKSFFNRIIFYLAVRCKSFRKIKLYNFTLTSQMVAEKTAKSFRGLLFLLHPVHMSFMLLEVFHQLYTCTMSDSSYSYK